MNFTQVVQQPTRTFNNSNSLIDHVYLNEPESLEYCKVTPPLDTSDHNCISLSIKRPPRLVNHKRRTIWRYNQADFDDTANGLLSEISYDPLQSNNIDSSWTQWKDKFLSIMSQYIPNKIASIKNVGITRKVKLLIKKRSRLFQQAKRGHNPRVWKKYQSTRNKIVSAVRSAKATYLRNLTSQFNAPRDFWSHYHSVIQSVHLVSLLPLAKWLNFIHNTLSKANMLNKYFCTQNLILNQVPHHHQLLYFLQSPALRSACGNFCQPWRPKPHLVLIISSHMLKNTARSIWLFLHKLFNLSLSTCQLPSEWKVSNVTPIPKSGDTSQCSNYQPISLLYPKLLDASFTTN